MGTTIRRPSLIEGISPVFTTVERLVDTRGPEGRRGRGPRLVLSEKPQPGEVNEEIERASEKIERAGEDDDEIDIAIRRILAPTFQPEDVTALICSHEVYAGTVWNDPYGLQHLEFIRVEQP